MRIDKLELVEFKSYENLSVEFQPGVNLFVGTNGSGKTALLEALCVAAGGFFNSQEQKLQRPIEYSEIRIKPTNHQTQVETGQVAMRAESCTVKAHDYKKSFVWNRTIRRDTKSNDNKYLKHISDYGKNYFEKFEDVQDRTVAPIISYYSTQRLFKDSNLTEKQKFDPSNGRRNGYIQCLEEKAIKPLLTSWLANATMLRSALQRQELNVAGNTLEVVEAALRETLIYSLDLSENFDLKIFPNPFFENQLFIQFEENQILPLSYYSDGFRNLLFLIIDLFWRASILNPWLKFDDLKNEAFGVVMIDEIDLHLHPKWQAKTISLLQKLLPNVQFFITTHSPTVVANFDGGTLYVIKEKEGLVESYFGNYFGKAVNEVLRDVLGANDRHIQTQKKINFILNAIDQNRPEPDYSDELAQLIDILGIDDSDVQHIISLKEWKEYKSLNAENAIH